MAWFRETAGLAAFAVLLATSPASAFHEEGAGSCEGCHALHPERRAEDGLLRNSDPSSTCLRCHAELGQPHNVLSIDGASFTPGGDFYWLGRSYSWVEEGLGRSSPGDRHGHNVVSADYNLGPDRKNTRAPGGTYAAADLSCVSCHDPHGESAPRSFRLLAGRGYERGGPPFANEAPIALAPPSWTETDDSHVDYGSGMSEWCANCHGSLTGSVAQHPTGAAATFDTQTAEVYASYLRTGDFSGSADSSYFALVPFERGVSDPSQLDPTSTRGPEPGTSNVMCLSCHRAHASAFRSIGRWDFGATFLADSHPAIGDGGAGATDVAHSYYGRNPAGEWGPYQRSLCNKCHAKD